MINFVKSFYKSALVLSLSIWLLFLGGWFIVLGIIGLVVDLFVAHNDFVWWAATKAIKKYG